MCVSMIGMSASESAARAFFKTAGTAVAATAAFTKGRRETGGDKDLGMGRKSAEADAQRRGIELADRLACDRGPANFLLAKRLTATANGQHGQRCARAEARKRLRVHRRVPVLISAEHLPCAPSSWSAQG